MSSQRKFTFAISSPDEFLVISCYNMWNLSSIFSHSLQKRYTVEISHCKQICDIGQDKHRQNSFHVLATEALNLVAVTVSQAYVERAFSECRDMCAGTSNRMNNNLEQRVFLRTRNTWQMSRCRLELIKCDAFIIVVEIKVSVCCWPAWAQQLTIGTLDKKDNTGVNTVLNTGLNTWVNTRVNSGDNT